MRFQITRQGAPPRGPVSIPDHHVIQTPEQLEWLERYLSRTKEIVSFDTETRGCVVGEESPVYKAKATCTTFSTAEYPNLYLDNYGKYQGNLRVIKRWAEDPDRPKIGHNILPFDKHVLANHGINLRGVYADTLPMDFMLDTSRVGRHKLEIAVYDWFGEEHDDYKTTFSVNVPKKDGTESKRWEVLAHYEWQDRFGVEGLERVVRYACKDTRIGLRLFEHHRQRLEEIEWAPNRGQSYWDFYKQFTLPFSEVLFKMERRGVLVDLALLETLKVQYRIQAMHKARGFIHGLADLGIPTEFLRTFNPGSPKQMMELLYDRLGFPITKWTGGKPGKGQPSVDAEVLDALAGKCPPLALYREQKQIEKLLTTYILAMLEWAPQYRGRIHTSLNQIGAQTGRLSSSNPNLQNIPIRMELGKRIRAAFTVPKGKKQLNADYSQIESRIMAHRSKDRILTEFILKDGDTHSLTAYFLMPEIGMQDVRDFVDETYGGPTPEALKWIKANHEDIRAKAKTLNFAIQYGAGAKRAATVFGVSDEVGQAAIDRYMDGYPGVAKFIERRQEQVQERGYVRTVLGRFQHLPHAVNGSFAAQKAGMRQAVNYDIQGGAADIIMLAMLLIDRDEQLQKWDCQLLLQVHDELMFEVPEENAKRAMVRVKEIMENPLEPFGFNNLSIPTIAAVGMGNNWGEAH